MIDDGICWDAGNATWRSTSMQATRLDPTGGDWIRVEWAEDAPVLRREPPRCRWWARTGR